MNSMHSLVERILRIASSTELVYEDDLLDMDIDSDPYVEARNSGINILSHMEFCCGHVSDGKLISGLFLHEDPEDFQFDIFVNDKFRNQGLASSLVDIAISMGEDIDANFNIHVINPKMRKLLESKGFSVLKHEIGDENDVIMTRSASSDLQPGDWVERIDENGDVLKFDDDPDLPAEIRGEPIRGKIVGKENAKSKYFVVHLEWDMIDGSPPSKSDVYLPEELRKIPPRD